MQAGSGAQGDRAVERVTDIIEEVKEKICNDYCKYAVNIDNMRPEEYDKLLAEICDKCPLNRL